MQAQTTPNLKAVSLGGFSREIPLSDPFESFMDDLVNSKIQPTDIPVFLAEGINNVRLNIPPSLTISSAQSSRGIQFNIKQKAQHNGMPFETIENPTVQDTTPIWSRHRFTKGNFGSALSSGS